MFNFTGKKVLVVGDVMLDRYVYGSASRLSPEAPVPVLRVSNEEAKLGGASNVAKGLSDLGCETFLVSVIGNDANGLKFLSIIEQTGIDPIIIPDAARPTTTKTRFLSGCHQILRADEEEIGAISISTENRLIGEIQNLINCCDAVVLSDYAKGVLNDRVIRAAIDHAKIPVIVDPKRNSFAPYRGAYLITPNVQELFQATGEENLDLAAAIAFEQSSVQGLLVTRSEKGMSLYTQNETFHLHSRADKVVDVCGAGDTVVATIAACLASGLDLKQSVIASNNAAAVVVGKLGTATLTVSELQASYLTTNGKKASVEAAESVVNAWKAQGLRVGFTNGCFDLLHPGHVTMLQKCADECDRLVLGINSDASIKRLKGKGRPIQDETSRATVIAALGSVDLVVMFTEDTPLELIERLKPNILFKGADYTESEVVGSNYIKSIGGQVKLIDLEEGHSTTSIIKRAKL